MADNRSMESRVGRTNQRYTSHGHRLVAGVIPLNRPFSPSTSITSPSQPSKVLLIQSTRRENPEWVLPKGGWETDETCPEAALREAWEEGGIVCKIERDLGCIEEIMGRKKERKEGRSPVKKQNPTPPNGVVEERNGMNGNGIIQEEKKNGDERPKDSCGKDGKGCLFQFYEVTVLEEKEEWPEAHKRAKKWFEYEEAIAALNGRVELRDALERSSLGRIHRAKVEDGCR